MNAVVELFAGTGRLGVELAKLSGASSVVLVDVHTESCMAAKQRWNALRFPEVKVVQVDLRQPTDFGIEGAEIGVVANPPHVPLPPPFSAWRNVYGGEDGLACVRHAVNWTNAQRCVNSFAICTYLLSRKNSLDIRDVDHSVWLTGSWEVSVNHFPEPAWQQYGGVSEGNPGQTAVVMHKYATISRELRTWFASLATAYPFIHHVLLHGSKIH